MSGAEFTMDSVFAKPGSDGASHVQLACAAAASTFMMMAALASTCSTSNKRQTAAAEIDEDLLLLSVDQRRGSSTGRRKKARVIPISKSDNFYYKYYPGNGQPPYPVNQNPAGEDQIDPAAIASARRTFRDTYGVEHDLFEELLTYCKDELTVGKDGVGVEGMMPELALLIALRKLRTSDPSVQFKQDTGYGTSTVDKKFRIVVETLVEKLKPICLPGYFHPSMDEARESEFSYNASIGFVGGGGSIDGSLVEWGKCPKEDQGQHKGHKGCGIVVHAVAFHTLLCAHLFVGVPGAANDVQVLYRDQIFHQLLSGLANIATRLWTIMGFPIIVMYFLADEIYPNMPIFVKPYPNDGVTEDQKLFNTVQEATRKSVERLFGVVQGRWKIVRHGNKIDYHDREFVVKIIQLCFMLHNLIVIRKGGTLSPTGFDGNGRPHFPTLVSGLDGGIAEFEIEFEGGAETHNEQAALERHRNRLLRKLDSTHREIYSDTAYFNLRRALADSFKAKQ